MTRLTRPPETIPARYDSQDYRSRVRDMLGKPMFSY